MRANQYIPILMLFVDESLELDFPEPATEFAVLLQNVHFEVMAIIIFVVLFVTYMLIRIIFMFKKPLERDLSSEGRDHAEQIVSKSIIYLEFL